VYAAERGPHGIAVGITGTDPDDIGAGQIRCTARIPDEQALRDASVGQALRDTATERAGSVGGTADASNADVVMSAILPPQPVRARQRRSSRRCR
jgi:hypothetical protein